MNKMRNKVIEVLWSVDTGRIAGRLLFLVLTALCVLSGDAYAQINDGAGFVIDSVARNATISIESVPGIITAGAYLFGLILAVQGIQKMRLHVENPGQNPLRGAVGRLCGGGGLFALPIILESMQNTINAGVDQEFDPTHYSLNNLVSSVLGAFGSLAEDIIYTVNGVMAAVVEGVDELPGIVSALAYMIGLWAAVMAVVKFKDHVDNPDQTPMREGVVRLLFGGCMFALPSVLNALAGTVGGENGPGLVNGIIDVFGQTNFVYSGYALSLLPCDPTGISSLFGNNSLGSAICATSANTGAAAAFLTAVSYLFGLVLTVWGLTKIRDHGLNPGQVKLTDGISKLAAAAMFLCLPVIVSAIKQSITPVGATAVAALPVTSYRGEGFDFGVIDDIIDIFGGGDDGGACAGLDGMLSCFTSDILGPFHIMMNFFTFAVGILLIMVGISRMLKGAQEGPKAPGGLGTMMTFFAGGALISYNEFIRSLTLTFLGDVRTKTFANMEYTDGMSEDEQNHIYLVINAVLKFMIIVGLVSFVRGLFIVRSVAEGSGQASMMSGLTHLAGGTLAVNLGGIMNAVQSTLGITGYGITFS